MTVVGSAEVEIRAKDAGVQKDIEKLFGGAAGPAKEFEKVVDRVTGGLGSGFTKAGAAAAAGLGVLAVAAGAIKSAFTFEDVGKDILKLQRLTGETAEDASRLRFAAQQSGVGVDALSRSLVLLSKNVASGKSVFTQYGVATVDATGKTLPLTAVLLNLADRYTKLENPIDRSALAQEAFGRGGRELLPFLARGRAGIEELMKSTEKYGLVLNQANLVTVKAAIQAQREQSAAFQGLQVQIGAQVLPALTALEKALTQGLLVSMPIAARVIGLTVVPAFDLLAAVVGPTTRFLVDHHQAVTVLAEVVGAALVPALVKWAATQAVVVGETFVLNLRLGAQAALLFAEKLGVLTLAEDSYAVSVTAANIATLGVVGVVALTTQRMLEGGGAIQQWADKIVKGAHDSQDAVGILNAKIRDLEADPNEGRSRLDRFFSFDHAGPIKAQAEIQALRGKLDDLAKTQRDAERTASGLEDQFTKDGLALDDLGTKTGFTKEQILQLADSMKIDLSKATAEQTDALERQARRLGINSSAALKLADDNAVLADFTKDATAKTNAFADALNVTIGSKISSLQADQAMESAQKALQNVQKDNAEKQLAANRNVEQTIRSLTSATNARASAEEALQAILHPTARTKEEADLGLSDAKIAADRATLAEKQAQERLNKLRGTGTPDEIKSAELDLADARNNVVHASERVADAQAKVNALTPQGIRNSKEYRDATARLADATQSEADARAAATRAQADAKQIAEDTAGRASDLAGKVAAVASAAVAQANATYALTGSQQASFGVLDRYSNYLRDTLSSLGQTPGEIDKIIERLGILNQHYLIVAGSVESARQAVGPDFNSFFGPTGPLKRESGGYIPGSPGSPVPVIGHAGEFVLSRDMLAGRQAVPASVAVGGGTVETHAHVHIEGGVDQSVAAQAEHGARIVSWMLPTSGRR